MADALLSPGVGLAFAGASAGVVALSARKVREEMDERGVPLMGVTGAFVFAAQMINFTIPGTGSSGHLGGGLLLTVLLGPWAAFLTLTSVLVVQALLFADGGLLALGTNAFNLGVFPCFLGGMLFRAMAGERPGRARRTLAATAAAVAGLELGAFGVVVQTLLSGRSGLPFGKFAALMMGIHLPIGLVEGLVTAAVLAFVARVRPELAGVSGGNGGARRSLAPVVVSFLGAALMLGGALSWFASSRPDGLEWSVGGAGGPEGDEAPGEGLAGRLRRFQERTSVLPDYGFRGEAAGPSRGPSGGKAGPAVDAGTSASGLLGSLIVLGLVGLSALVLVRLRGRAGRPSAGG